MAGVRIGELRERVELLIPARSRTDSGSETITYTTRATVWARKRVLGGRERYEAQQMTGESDVEFAIRYRTDVRESWRVKHGPYTYEITSPPAPDEKRMWMLLNCREVR